MNLNISENKKERMLELLHTLEDEIFSMFHTLEDDETLSDERFRVYEKYTDQLYTLHNDILEEIIFA